ncbi:MAG: hypothetical protein JRH01_20665 [Deltaproteobacteria bacterium]|nr:hypothetical protein [Deltaproteobacteria bacterium]
MGHAGAKGRLAQVRHALGRHERTLAAAYLAIVVGVLLLWLVPGVRTLVSDQARKATNWSDRQWVARVDTGVALLDAGRLDEAEAALASLDRRLPARHIKHGLASERTRILEGLARTYWAQDRKRKTLETLRRLTTFEPRGFAFHVLHAEAAASFGELDEARQARAQVLAIQPNHLATVRAVVRDYADRGDAAGAVDAYEAYLDAYGVAQLFLRGDALPVYVRTDARAHDFELPVGDGSAVPRPEEFSSLAPLEVLGIQPEAAFEAGKPGREGAPVRVLVLLSAFKPVDAELWAMVQRACRNLTAWERLERLEARTRVEAVPRDPFAGDPT